MEKYKIENFIGEQEKNLMSSDWVEKLKQNPIDLIKEKKDNTIEEIKEKYSGKIAALDFYIKDMEKNGRWDGNALRMDDILSVDHHAPTEEFSKNISSTNLAIDWVNKNGVLDKNYSVMINHTDCDSVLSALIIRGILPPDEIFGKAAIAADHTGEENEIADLLQALESKRDLEFSAINLKLLLGGKDLDPEAQKLLEKIYSDRKKAGEVVEKGEMISLGGLMYTKLDKKIESTYFLALLPDARIILIFCPFKKNLNLWEAKIILGAAAPAGLTLGKLEIEDIDPNFGYRWNAGSNTRAGGTSLSVEEYAGKLNEKLQKYLDKMR